MAKTTILVTSDQILLWAANAYNFDAKQTALVLPKEDPEYIEVLWEAKTD